MADPSKLDRRPLNINSGLRPLVDRRLVVWLACLVMAGCGDPVASAAAHEEKLVAARVESKTQVKSSENTNPECFVTVNGWKREDQSLYGGCDLRAWQGFVGSTDLPALFARYKLPGRPPLLNPTGYADNNMIEYRLTWLGSPDLPPRVRRWRAPARVDCARRMAGTDACYTDDIDPVLFEAADFIAAGNRAQPYLKFYWDARHQALLAQYEPWDLYSYAAFYVGDVQVELRAYHGTQRYFGTLIDLARREMSNWTAKTSRAARRAEGHGDAGRVDAHREAGAQR